MLWESQKCSNIVIMDHLFSRYPYLAIGILGDVLLPGLDDGDALQPGRGGPHLHGAAHQPRDGVHLPRRVLTELRLEIPGHSLRESL